VIVFRTQFPLSIETDMDQVLRIGKTWIEGSPHSNLQEKIKAIGDKVEADLTSDKEKFRLLKHQSKEECHAGINYNLLDKGFEWNTYIVAKKTNQEVWLSFEISRDSDNPTLELPKPKKPYFIKQILKACGHGKDGYILTNGKPKNLSNTDIEYAARLMNGQSEYSMPIVYISATNSNKHVVNPTTLAEYLYGMAHIFVEPDREFAYRLRLDTKSQNANNGAIGIYWPEGLGKEILFRGDENHDEFGNRIYNTIREALLSKRLLRDCCWNYIEQLKIQQRIKELKDTSNKSINEYIDAFDIENNIKCRQLEEAENEIRKLKNEIRKISLENSTQTDGQILFRGEENDLYEGEMIDFILDILNREYDSAATGARKRDILNSIIENNSIIGKREQIKKDIKETLKTYKKMTSSIKSALRDIGFQINEDGKHFKLLFNNDERYSVILPKTSSDHRVGMNLVSDISKKLF